MTAPSLDQLTACGSHQKGHFNLSSGLHSGDYLQCALYLAQSSRAAEAGKAIADALRSNAARAELVVAPAMGGLIIGHETARALDLPFIFTEREGTEMALRRGFAVTPGQKIVIIEDVVTTGKSTREVISLLTGMGAEVVAMASLINRSGRPNPFDPLPFHPLLEVSFPTWKPEDCPLCAAGEPMTKPGSRPVE